MSFSTRLIEAREKKRYSQRFLAKKANIARSQIRDYEEGNTIPTMEPMGRLSVALDESIDFLWNGHEKFDDGKYESYLTRAKGLPLQEKRLLLYLLERICVIHDLDNSLSRLSIK